MGKPSDTKETVRRFRWILRQFERIVSSHNKTCCSQVSMAQCHVLLEIDAAGTPTCSDLARLLRLDISTISRTVDSLVSAALVRRSENPKDRRSVVLRCTKKGRDLCRSINRDADNFYADIISDIQEEDRAQILESFEMLVKVFVEREHKSPQPSSCCECNGDECSGNV